MPKRDYLLGVYAIASTGNLVEVSKEMRGRRLVYRWKEKGGMDLFKRDIGSRATLQTMIRKHQLYKPVSSR